MNGDCSVIIKLLQSGIDGWICSEKDAARLENPEKMWVLVCQLEVLDLDELNALLQHVDTSTNNGFSFVLAAANRDSGVAVAFRSGALRLREVAKGWKMAIILE